LRWAALVFVLCGGVLPNALVLLVNNDKKPVQQNNNQLMGKHFCVQFLGD
jgi:hypothetical protein